MTNQNKFTPGPWRAYMLKDLSLARIWSVEGKRTEHIAMVINTDNAPANASLISAAPDLLARLLEARNIIKGLLAQCEQADLEVDDSLYLDFQREACETIAKARGEA